MTDQEGTAGDSHHYLLDPLEEGQEVRVELENDQIVGEIDEKRRTEEGEFVAQSMTVIEGGSPLARAIWDLEAEYDPRDGWSSVTANKRYYDGSTTEWIEKGTVEQIVAIDSGIDPDRLDPGVTIEGIEGDHYRVVVPPWEREYDSKALAYNLDSGSNVCEKVKPEEVVRRVE